MLALPPVERGHAAPGDDPGERVGALVAEALGRAVVVGDGEGVVVGVSDREADAGAVGLGEGRASG